MVALTMAASPLTVTASVDWPTFNVMSTVALCPTARLHRGMDFVDEAGFRTAHFVMADRKESEAIVAGSIAGSAADGAGVGVFGADGSAGNESARLVGDRSGKTGGNLRKCWGHEQKDGKE